MNRPRSRRAAALSGGGASVGVSGAFDDVSGFTDFSENTPGIGMPAGWKSFSTFGNTWEILSDVDVDNDSPMGGQILMAHPDVAVRTSMGIIWDTVPSPLGEDGETLALVRHPITNVNANGFYAGLAFTTLADAGGGYALCSCFGCYSTSWTDGLRMLNGSVPVFYDSAALPQAALGGWSWIRYQRLGTAVKAKWWHVAVAEPALWRYEGTLTDLPLGGQPGLLVRSFEATELKWACAYMAFTTDPSGAPLIVPVIE